MTTTVRAAGTVFNAPQINQETHLEGFTIEALRASTPGASTYGVRLGGGLGDLYVRYNLMSVQGGQDGTNGTNASDCGTICISRSYTVYGIYMSICGLSGRK